MPSRANRDESFLGHFAELTTRFLTQAGIASAKAEEIAVSVLDEVRREFGGDSVYIAKGSRADIDERQAEAYHLWQQGARIDEIASRFGCTRRWAYSLVSKERARLKSIRDKCKRSSA